MRLIDLSLADPAENLALDEALLDSVEAGAAPEALRFWECPAPIVVLGTGQVLAEEVDEAGCAAAGVPVLRRCSAGGCVLQGPGSLNYSLALAFENHADARGLHASYAYILGMLRRAFEQRGVRLRHEGICDLTLDGRKVSGNAQRRRRNAFLHHGTLLHAVDHDLMARCLREPADRPDYRGAATHRDFVGVVPLDPAVLRRVVCDAFGVRGPDEAPTPEERAAAARLAAEKYRDPAWTRRR
jgi:lipoate-protein ligase A